MEFRFIELAPTIKSITNVRISHLSGLYFAHQIDSKNEKLLFIVISIDKENQSNLKRFASFFCSQSQHSFGFPEFSDSFRAHIYLFVCAAVFFSLSSTSSNLDSISKFMITQIRRTHTKKWRRTRSEKAKKTLAILAEIKPVRWLAVIQVYSVKKFCYSFPRTLKFAAFVNKYYMLKTTTAASVSK